MNLLKNCVSVVLFFAIFATDVCSANEDGFLNATCKKAQDCYVLDDPNKGLWLACWFNVNKCKCQNTFSSEFNLKWEDGQCLMSKYGPCGGKGDLVVGCQDGFVCVENQCRDPSHTRSVKVNPYVFTESECSDCRFDDLHLQCNRHLGQCECAKVYVADARETQWDIRSYDGNNNCSVGKFGPCGTKNSVTIDCHGDGITCVAGRCLDANHLIAEVGEGCATQENCKEGLLCSWYHVCIEPQTSEEYKYCYRDNECKKELQCKRTRFSDESSSARCTNVTEDNQHDWL